MNFFLIDNSQKGLNLAMDVNKVVILGGGVLGSQIAFQSAFSGIETVIYDISDKAISAAKEKIATLPPQYKRDLAVSDDRLAVAAAQLSLTTDLESAISHADVIIEAVPERLDIKKSSYASLQPYIGANTLVLTNSSTLLPSQINDFVPNKERFLAMHFANLIWLHNAAEIMWAPGTRQNTIDDAVNFAEQIQMAPFKISTEISGYVMNALFLPLINAALLLWADKDLDPIMIDQDWVVSMGVDRGPFGFVDIMGINTAINIETGFYENTKDERFKKVVAKLTKEYLEKGKMGVQSGEGFYKYPKPLYQQPEFRPTVK